MSLDRTEWEEWIRVKGERHRTDRFALMRAVRWELSESTEGKVVRLAREGVGITVNVSNHGLCLITDWVPTVNQVVRIHMPMTWTEARTPTLAEVRWVRALPFEPKGLHAVGFRYVL